MIIDLMKIERKPLRKNLFGCLDKWLDQKGVKNGKKVNRLFSLDDWEGGTSVIKIGKPREMILLRKETAEGFGYIF